MKKYFFLIVGLIALAVGTLSAQKTRGGISSTTQPSLETPIVLTPVTEEPSDPPPSGSADDRTVVWVHGYEGSRGSWQLYGNKFASERKMNSVRAQYGGWGHPITSIGQGAEETQVDIAASGVVPNSNNIFIGHSMGGLVTREIDRRRTNAGQPELFGGFITFSTPHKGAVLADNVMNGKADIFVDDAIQAAVTPFLGFSMVGNLVLNFIEMNDNLQLIRRLLPRVTAIGDLATNSNFISTLNSFQHTNKKIITVAARESGEKMWRELSSLVWAPSSSSLHEYKDSKLPQLMNFARGTYNAAGIASDALAAINALRLNPFGYAKWHFRAVKFREGASWIKNAPKVFDDLAGANRTESRQVTVRQIRQDIMDQYNTWMDSRNCEGGLRTPRVDCSFERFIGTLSRADRNNMYETVTRTEIVPILNQENDGIAMKYSTNGLEGPNVVKFETDLRPDLGVNHQECMNHEFITKIFNGQIFDGSSGSFFSIAKR